MNGRKKRGFSLGTVVMGVLTLLVLGGSALVMSRLSGGATVDLNAVASEVVNLAQGNESGSGEEIPLIRKSAENASDSAGKNAPAAVIKEPTNQRERASFTLTVGGVMSLAGEVRKNSLSADTKKYDYSDVLMMLESDFHADLNGVFLENLLSDTTKITDTVAPENVGDVLKHAGINLVACGFPKAFDQGEKGISETRMALMERSILPMGLREADEQETFTIRTVNGCQVALLQYTDGVSASVRKTMKKNGLEDMIPAAEEARIVSEIRAAREQGAQAVIVMLHWGKTGKAPEKAQVSLATAIAEAGADLIIGAGSRQPQGAEYLTGPEGRRVLCCWSLGSLITGDRGNVRRIAGYLLHATFRMDADGARLEKAEYTPVYTWKFKQDGSYYYRCVAADQPAPDGMDNEQKTNMEKALSATQTALSGSPVTQCLTDSAQ